ncbi:MAG: MerR family transcriptional regulator [Lachnospiraceae bacterium]|nr:MerR family transcriptional regulator [Lachnospiraceae bacterium]
MTIKEFSELCGCNPQTIRYYDRENLLKPVKVDEWSGYRFYEEKQALVFVKIKNLQKAGFSIEEIRTLLDKEDAEIYRAFERKIAETEKHLQEIRSIQKTYQTEMTNMRNVIENLQKKIKTSMETYSPTEEFGISEEEYREMMEEVERMFESALASGELSGYTVKDYPDEHQKQQAQKQQEQEFREYLKNPMMERIYEKHEWKRVKDFLGEIPELENGGAYFFLFGLEPEKLKNEAFANTMLGILCRMNHDKQMSLKCSVIRSEDEENHFWLLKSK